MRNKFYRATSIFLNRNSESLVVCCMFAVKPSSEGNYATNLITDFNSPLSFTITFVNQVIVKLSQKQANIAQKAKKKNLHERRM